MRLFALSAVRRAAGLAVLLFFTIPFGLSVVGCGNKSAAPIFCNDGSTGPTAGQLQTISLSPSLAIQGESLNFGQVGSSLAATGTDCKGSSVSVSKYTYATSDMSLADINPNTGQVCGGTWNRNSGSGIPDYTVCSPPTAAATRNGLNYLAYVTATAQGITSNAVPVYVHATVTGIVFGQTTGCKGNDPDTSCNPASPTTLVSAPVYDGSTCISQNKTAQIVARIYTNNSTDPANNITLSAGHLSFGTQGASGIVSLDQNGVATAGQPGSVSLTASLSNSGSAQNLGFFSTCPPASITLTPVGTTGGTTSPINLSLNNTQQFTTTVKDTNGVTLNGVDLTFESTTPQTINASSGGGATAVFPGAATITAICQPPTCNPAPLSQLGYLGNGKPITSNGIQLSTPGSSSTEIFVGSTQSQYIYPVDFSTQQPGSLVKLPYVPNSMVITQDGSTIYMGSSAGLMTLSTANGSVSSTNVTIQGTVLSVSPDGGTVVVTDPSRHTISLVTSGSVTATYVGIGTHAQWTPDSQTVYITTATDPTDPNGGKYVLSHSTFTNWTSTPVGPPDALYNDVAVMVPTIGAYFAGTPATDGRSYCSLTTSAGLSATPPVPVENNTFNPLADEQPVVTDRLAATADGNHILGASVATGVSDIFLNGVTGQAISGQQPNGPQACTTVPQGSQVKFTTQSKTLPFAGITPTTITGVAPASNSAIAFVTYNGTGGKIPYYLPTTGSASGSLNYFTFSTTGGTAVAPISGVFSTDNLTFYVGTTGDNRVHLINVTYPTNSAPQLNDSQQIAPALPAASGSGTAQPDLIVQRPRRVTS